MSTRRASQSVRAAMLSVAAALAAGVAGCAFSDSPTPPTGTLLGVALDTLTDAPISGASVTLGDATTRTDALGTFRLSPVPSGSQDVIVAHPDYETRVSSVRVKGGDSVSVTVTLRDASLVPQAPRGIAAEPGPSEGATTLTWQHVSRANSYALYWSESPTVTPATGTRVYGVSPPFVHRDRDKTKSYYYVVTGIGVFFEGPPSPIVASRARDKIALQVQSPAPGISVGASLPFTVGVNAPAGVSTITASVGTVSVPLSFQPSIGLYTGTLPMTAVAVPSIVQVTVRATDASGNTAEANVIVIHDRSS